MTPESKVKRKVSALFKELGIWYFMPASNGFGRAGVPDYVACVDGTFVGVETKADKTKKPTPLQIQCGELIQQSGGYWMVVCDDTTLEELRELCKSLRKPRASCSS
jgi:hypothetical protein